MTTPQVSLSLEELVRAAADTGATRSRTAKIGVLAGLLRSLPESDVPAAVGLLLGAPIQGRLGVGWRSATADRPGPAATASLSVDDVDQAFTTLAGAKGAGSSGVRRTALTALMGRATAAEQDFLLRVITGELRTGALAGVLTDAVAVAAALPKDLVRRAAMLSGDLGVTAQTALAGGDLARIDLRAGVPVQPMLASSAPTVAEAVAAAGPAAVEYKLDGARLQVHRTDGVVRAYTRSLAEVTQRVPEIVALVSGFDGGDLVLDGETLTLDADGRARPFQDTMSRFGGQAEGTAVPVELTVAFFDVLFADGCSLIDEPLAHRRDILRRIVGPSLIGGAVVDPDDPGAAAGQAQQILDEALAAGHEGVVVKALGAPYAAGRRGAHWVKVKPVYTYDLVVLAVERGSGRRSGWLSNLHLGAHDPDGRFGEPGGFVMVGKTFKGLTDETLRWQTEFFPTIAIGDDGYVLSVEPTVVVEIAIDGVQRSTRYPGGVALRFARVKRYRTGDDAKPAVEADTVDSLRRRLPTGS